jgi:integrase
MHTLRRSYGTLLAAAGTPPKDLMALMGHARLETTMRFYVDLSEGYLQRASGAIEAALAA